jgi:Ecdysteroid kinase-like family
MGTMIPATAGDLTPSWLSEALGTDVRSAESEDLGEGKGILATVLRVHLDGDGLPPTLVAKLPSPHEQNLETSIAYQFYRREVEFYRHVAGHLDITTAPCRYADVSDDGGSFVLLLDEVVGQRQPDQIAGLTIADCEVVLDDLAVLHAHWWDTDELRNLDWLPDFDYPPYRAVEAHLQQYFPAFREMWGDQVAPAGLATAERQIQHVLELMEHWVTTKPSTFAHYDVRGDNMMFDAENRLTLLDWQLCLQAPGAMDVAYLLGTNISIDDRRSHEHRLVRRYHDRITELGVDYPIGRLEDDYRASMLNVTNMFIIGALLDPGNDRGRELMRQIVTRCFQASADLDAGEFVPS